MRDMKQCIVCGKSFTSERNREYCSDNCRKKKWRVDNRDKDLKQRRNYNKRRWEKVRPIHSEKKCEYCGRIFMPHSHTPTYQKYCSDKCRLVVYRETHREDLNRWRRESYRRHKDVKRKADADYKDMKRFSGNRIKVLERDNYTCQECGDKGPKLNVHHKDHSGQTDNPNNEMSNLITLCAACHKRIHLH